MPQASEELRRVWDGPSDQKALKHLRDNGYILTKEYQWVIPKGKTPTEVDRSAVLFMIDEWDYGGFANV